MYTWGDFRRHRKGNTSYNNNTNNNRKERCNHNLKNKPSDPELMSIAENHGAKKTNHHTLGRSIVERHHTKSRYRKTDNRKDLSFFKHDPLATPIPAVPNCQLTGRFSVYLSVSRGPHPKRTTSAERPRLR